MKKFYLGMLFLFLSLPLSVFPMWRRAAGSAVFKPNVLRTSPRTVALGAQAALFYQPNATRSVSNSTRWGRAYNGFFDKPADESVPVFGEFHWEVSDFSLWSRDPQDSPYVIRGQQKFQEIIKKIDPIDINKPYGSNSDTFLKRAVRGMSSCRSGYAAMVIDSLFERGAHPCYNPKIAWPSRHKSFCGDESVYVPEWSVKRSSPLWTAALNGNTDIFKQILSAMSDQDVCNNNFEMNFALHDVLLQAIKKLEHAEKRYTELDKQGYHSESYIDPEYYTREVSGDTSRNYPIHKRIEQIQDFIARYKTQHEMLLQRMNNKVESNTMNGAQQELIDQFLVERNKLFKNIKFGEASYVQVN